MRDVTGEERKADPQFGRSTSDLGLVPGARGSDKCAIKTYHQLKGAAKNIELGTKGGCKNHFVPCEDNHRLPQTTEGARRWRLTWRGHQQSSISPRGFQCCQRQEYPSHPSTTVRRRLRLLGEVDRRGTVNGGLFGIAEQCSQKAQAWGSRSWESSLRLHHLLVYETTVKTFTVSWSRTCSSWRQERSNSRWNLPRMEIKP